MVAEPNGSNKLVLSHSFPEFVIRGLTQIGMSISTHYFGNNIFQNCSQLILF
jgi:hypothetical protein